MVYCFQNFVELNFVSKNFSKSKWLNLGSDFIYIAIENFIWCLIRVVQMKAHIKKRLCSNFQLILMCLWQMTIDSFYRYFLTYNEAPYFLVFPYHYISGKVHPINLKFPPWTILIKIFIQAKFRVKNRIFIFFIFLRGKYGDILWQIRSKPLSQHIAIKTMEYFSSFYSSLILIQCT
jgi:hypothetical protein